MPGLTAKPYIDLVAVGRRNCGELSSARLAELGYTKMGTYFASDSGKWKTYEGNFERIVAVPAPDKNSLAESAGWYLRKLPNPAVGIVGFIVHISDPGALEKVLTVVTLRANAPLRDEYVALKKRLVAATSDFQMYTIGKTDFMAKLHSDLEIPVFYGPYGCAGIDRDFMRAIYDGQIPQLPADPTTPLNAATHLWDLDSYYVAHEVGTPLGFALAMILVPKCSYLCALYAYGLYGAAMACSTWHVCRFMLGDGGSDRIATTRKELPPLAKNPHVVLKALISMGCRCVSWLVTCNSNLCGCLSQSDGDYYNYDESVGSAIMEAQSVVRQDAAFRPEVIHVSGGEHLVFPSAAAFGTAALKLLIECGWQVCGLSHAFLFRPWPLADGRWAHPAADQARLA